MHSTVIFDIDGTLLDTSKGIINSIEYTIDVMHLAPLSETELKGFVGYSPLQKAFEYYCKIDKSNAIQCANIYREYYKSIAYRQSSLYNDIVDLLEMLKNKNKKLGIATYKREDYAKLLIDYLGFTKYFKVICGADYKGNLSKKDILNKCMLNLYSDSKDCIFIGDSSTDAIAAQELGVDFIGVTYGFGFKNHDEINEFNPIFIADNVEQMIYYFKNSSQKYQK